MRILIRSLAAATTALLMAATAVAVAGTTTGPHGESAVPAASVTLTPEGWFQSLHRPPPATLTGG
jgi:hypothetical protein